MSQLGVGNYSTVFNFNRKWSAGRGVPVVFKLVLRMLSISVVFYCGEIMLILLTFDYSYISDDKLVD